MYSLPADREAPPSTAMFVPEAHFGFDDADDHSLLASPFFWLGGAAAILVWTGIALAVLRWA